MKKRKMYMVGILIILFLIVFQYEKISAQIENTIFQTESSQIIFDINTAYLFDSITASSPEELKQKKIKALDNLIHDEVSKFEEEEIEKERLSKIEQLKIDVINGLL